jgi:UDP-glucose-4-epimerase GalE
MRRAGVGRLVFSSTCATYGVPERMPITEDLPQQPINPYGATKLMIERVLRDYDAAYGLRSVALRYFNAAGCDPDGEIGEDHDPETHLIPLVLQVALGQREAITVFGTDYDTPDGTCIRDYIHVMDLADAHLLALEVLSEGGSRVYNLGSGTGYSVMQVIETARRITGHPIPVQYGPRRAGDLAVLVADSTRIKRELGWQPAYDNLERIIETAWQWHKIHPDGFTD